MMHLIRTFGTKDQLLGVQSADLYTLLNSMSFIVMYSDTLWLKN